MENEVLNAMRTLLKEELQPIHDKIDKNTLMLESLTIKVETMAEVQKSYMGQNEVAHSDIIKPLSEKIDVIELAVKDTSNRMKEVQKDLAKVARNTGENLAEIIELKAAK